MLSQIRPALVTTLAFTLLLGLAYPLAVTGAGALAFPTQAGGSLIRAADGRVIGSALLGQAFSAARYLHPRPSAAGSDGYDAASSGGSNLGPLNPALAERVRERTAALRAEGAGPIAADAVTASASGLDPHISPANAQRQAARIATARGVRVGDVERIIAAHTEAPWLGLFGEPRVNVLETNLALDAALRAAQPPPQ